MYTSAPPLELTTARWIVRALVVGSGIAVTLLSTFANADEPIKECPATTKAGPVGSVRLPRVTVLATGGTIAGESDSRAADAYTAGSVGAQQLIKAVPGIDNLARLSTEQVASIGSQDMNDTVWFALARRIQQISDKNEADAVVITHGTDTLEETAFFLDMVLHTDKPVVLVGSMRPANATSADGPNNLYEAVEVAACANASGRGVMVVLNDRIEGARWATKTNTTSVQTFRSPDSGSIGYVDPASVRFITSQHTAHSAGIDLPVAGTLPRVEIIYSHSNMDGLQIDDAVANGAKGIILAGVGDGNTSIAALAALERAVQKASSWFAQHGLDQDLSIAMSRLTTTRTLLSSPWI